MHPVVNDVFAPCSWMQHSAVGSVVCYVSSREDHTTLHSGQLQSVTGLVDAKLDDR